MSYDKDAAPLTPKLKFELALKVAIDPVTLAGTTFLAATDQAAQYPDYVEGWKGYGQRFGAVYTNDLTDIMAGRAIFPSILHQDPQYFYQGTGTTKSRLLHALSSPFICNGDGGLMAAGLFKPRRVSRIGSYRQCLLSRAKSRSWARPACLRGRFQREHRERSAAGIRPAKADTERQSPQLIMRHRKLVLLVVQSETDRRAQRTC